MRKFKQRFGGGVSYLALPRYRVFCDFLDALQMRNGPLLQRSSIIETIKLIEAVAERSYDATSG